MSLPEFKEGLVPDIARVELGLYSLDRAMESRGEIGLPLRSLVELYGFEHVGKSTLSFFILGAINPKGTVGIVDFETSVDPHYVPIAAGQAGFRGKIETVDYATMKGKKKIPRDHEDMAQEAANRLLEDGYNGFMVDSLGGWMSREEYEGDIGDANMGKRARAVAQWSRRCLAHLRISDDPKVVIALNHALPVMGGRGHYTPGGHTKSYAAGVRLFMYRKDSASFDDGCFQAEVRVEKLRYGGAHKERTGIVFIIPEMGVSKEMTAVLDCVRLELADRGSTVKLKGQSMGRINTLVKWAKKGEKSKFKPFFDALKEYDDGVSVVKE